MGIFSDIFGTGRARQQVENIPKEDDEQNRRKEFPIEMSMTFTPYRIKKYTDGYINLSIHLKNISEEKQLVSVDLSASKGDLVGFDSTCVSKRIEKKVGILSPNESKEITVPVWTTNQTRAGDYPIEVTVFIHYLNYNKVSGYMKKSTYLKVV